MGGLSPHKAASALFSTTIFFIYKFFTASAFDVPSIRPPFSSFEHASGKIAGSSGNLFACLKGKVMMIMRMIKSLCDVRRVCFGSNTIRFTFHCGVK